MKITAGLAGSDAAVEPDTHLATRLKQQPAALVGEPRGADGLTACALAYLALPNLIFVFGWFRLSLALLLCATMIFFIARVFHPRPVVWRSPHARSAIVLIVLMTCAWAAFGGGSHFMYANADWEIRDGVLADLVNSEWPVLYAAADGAPLILRSAIGYFLPPALLGKLVGVSQLPVAVYLWTSLGVLLFLLLLPLPRIASWRLALALLLVVFFSGMDFLGTVIATENLPIFPLRIEWWTPLSYPSLTSQLLWAPNHCLSSWIATLLYFRHRNGAEFFTVTAASLPLTLIWTPFTAIGLLPFVVLGTLKALRRTGWRTLPWRTILAALCFSLPIFLYLTIDIAGIDSTTATTPATTVVNYALQQVSLRTYLLFVCCEFIFLALVIAPHVARERIEFWLAVLVLLALPLLRFGPTNDIGLRLNTVPLVVLLAITLQVLFSARRAPLPVTLWLAWLFLAIGAHSAFNELWRSATFPRWPPNYEQTLADRQGGQPAAHYVGRLDSSPLAHWFKQAGCVASNEARPC